MLKRYFLDTEFNEDGRIIDLISLGLVCDDGREYYAISAEFDPNTCNNWVKANVLPLLPPNDYSFTWCNPSGVSYVSPLWKPRGAIASELIEFVGANQGIEPQFWAYFADYDWVALCQLYGPMVALPKGMPMYCNDIRQLSEELGRPPLPNQEGTEHDALQDAKWNYQVWQYLMAMRSPQLFGAR
jgi:hypothetical protein